jgi:hypothetical protein
VLLEEPAPWLFITVSKESDTGGIGAKPTGSPRPDRLQLSGQVVRLHDDGEGGHVTRPVKALRRLRVAASMSSIRWFTAAAQPSRHLAYRLSSTSTLLPARSATSVSRHRSSARWIARRGAG